MYGKIQVSKFIQVAFNVPNKVGHYNSSCSNLSGVYIFYVVNILLRYCPYSLICYDINLYPSCLLGIHVILIRVVD